MCPKLSFLAEVATHPLYRGLKCVSLFLGADSDLDFSLVICRPPLIANPTQILVENRVLNRDQDEWNRAKKSCDYLDESFSIDDIDIDNHIGFSIDRAFQKIAVKEGLIKQLPIDYATIQARQKGT